jgi:hypothetical protein
METSVQNQDTVGFTGVHIPPSDDENQLLGGDDALTLEEKGGLSHREASCYWRRLRWQPVTHCSHVYFKCAIFYIEIA